MIGDGVNRDTVMNLIIQWLGRGGSFSCGRNSALALILNVSVGSSELGFLIVRTSAADDCIEECSCLSAKSNRHMVLYYMVL